MKLTKTGIAGTYESSDLYVKIEPNDKEQVEINLSSPVKEQFGEHIEKIVYQVLESNKIKSARLELKDSGALDCVIKARVESAIFRATESKPNWEDLAKWID